MQRFFTKIFGIAAVILLTLFLIRAFNLSYPISVTTSAVSSELSVIGEGKVDVTPDSATVNAGMNITSASTVEDARKQVDTVSRALVENLTKLGIDKKDIKTTNYSVNPSYSYESSVPNRLNGYSANVMYAIKVKNIDIVAQVVDAATKSGANQINNIDYSIERPEKYREDARSRAIANARDQAQKLANSLGIRLGRVTNIVESNNGGPGPIPYVLKSDAIGIGSSQPNLQPGTRSVSSMVTLYFEKR